MMLISRDGRFEGMISGGCLEGDLLLHAASVFKSGKPSLVTYDMHADENLVWNLGLGCDGVIHLLLQRVDRHDEFAFLAPLEKSHSGRRACLIALLVESSDPAAKGDWALLDKTDISAGNDDLVAILRQSAAEWPAWRTQLLRHRLPDGEREILMINVPEQTRVLICGAGPDAVPVARVLAELDWEILLADHRPAYADARRFPAACRLLETRPGDLSDTIDLDDIDAVLIMSHHLENDAEYLRQVAGRAIPYLGVLGPAARRERLRDMADCPDAVLHGPAGLDIGAELPAAIALSIASEIHAVLNGREGNPLMMKAGVNHG
jgi:xanthine/CO dehydrogenase XdhC/CoxF family maturation factor